MTRAGFLAVLLFGTACSPQPQEQASAPQREARLAVGDYDGDGAEDRVELWRTPTTSRLLAYLAARPREPIVLDAPPQDRIGDYVRTRPPATYTGRPAGQSGAAERVIDAEYETISYGGTGGAESLFYWDGAAFQEIVLSATADP